MLNICICNEKGGVLKTTLTLHLAYYLAHNEGKKLLVVDLDAQGNLSGFFQRRDRDDTRVICEVGQLLQFGAEKFDLDYDGQHPISLLTTGDSLMNLNSGLDPIDVIDALRDQLGEAKGYDYILLDTPPGRSNTLLAGIAVSDMVIIPSDFTVFSQEGVAHVSETITMCRDSPRIGSSTRLLGVVPTKLDGHDQKQRKLVERELRGAAGKMVVSKPISVRPSTRQVMDSHKMLWEAPKGIGEAGKKEMTALMKVLTKKIGELTDGG